MPVPHPCAANCHCNKGTACRPAFGLESHPWSVKLDSKKKGYITRSSSLSDPLPSEVLFTLWYGTTKFMFFSPKYMHCLQKVLYCGPLVNSKSGFYSRYVLVPKKDGTISRSQASELCPHATAIQNVNFETDPRANMPRGLIYVCGSERCLLSHPNSTPSQTALEIIFRGSGLSVHSLSFSQSHLDCPWPLALLQS